MCSIFSTSKESPSSFGSQPRLIPREDADKLASIVSSVERNVSIDSDILKIIVEEADAYIYGFSDIDRVCRIIQLKAQDVIMNR